MDKKQQFTLWYFLGSVVLLFAAQTYFARQHVGTISYSDFKSLLQAGKVSDAQPVAVAGLPSATSTYATYT